VSERRNKLNFLVNTCNGSAKRRVGGKAETHNFLVHREANVKNHSYHEACWHQAATCAGLSNGIVRCAVNTKNHCTGPQQASHMLQGSQTSHSLLKCVDRGCLQCF
jgi:hypothetical protein